MSQFYKTAPRAIEKMRRRFTTRTCPPIMDHTPPLSPLYTAALRVCWRAIAALSRLLRRALRDWWEGMGSDEMATYLSQSTDPIDYEYRLRRWNENAGRYHMPLL
jgi:hypothetical protein